MKAKPRKHGVVQFAKAETSLRILDQSSKLESFQQISTCFSYHFFKDSKTIQSNTALISNSMEYLKKKLVLRPIIRRVTKRRPVVHLGTQKCLKGLRVGFFRINQKGKIRVFGFLIEITNIGNQRRVSKGVTDFSPERGLISS